MAGRHAKENPAPAQVTRSEQSLTVPGRERWEEEVKASLNSAFCSGYGEMACLDPLESMDQESP